MSKREYEVGENVVCLYKDAPYDAKIFDIKADKGKDCYWVHFKGWNNRYDERIPIGEEKGRIFKGTAQEYAAKHGAELPPTAQKSAKKKPAAARLDASESAKTDSSREDTPTTSRPAKTMKKNQIPPAVSTDMNVDLPKPLRKILIDDHDMIQKNFVTIVPATHTVDQIIIDYIKTVPVGAENMQTMDDLLIEYDSNDIKVSNLALICTARGLVDYFNVVLGVSKQDRFVASPNQMKKLRFKDEWFSSSYQLLYKFERGQYNDLVQSKGREKGLKYGNIANLPEHGFRSSEQYGIVHLLRMLAKLPDLLKLTEWNDHLINRIMLGVHDLCVFLNKNHTKYYKGAEDYEGASHDYLRRAQTIEEAAPGTSNQ